VHGLEHWTEFYTDYGRALQKRFFDHFLRGADNGWEREPRVMLQVRRPDRFVPRAEAAWPLPRTRWTTLYLDAGARTLGAEVPETASAVEFDAAGDGVTFAGPALAEETELTGPVSARLFVSSSTEDADLFVVLRVFDAAGREVDFQGALDPHAPVGQGWLRASHRRLDPALSTAWRPYHTHDRREPLVPGRVYECEVEIWPTSVVVPAGGRVALAVLGRDFERPGDGLQLTTFATAFRGSGPFLHTDPEDRPASVFAGRTAIHTGGSHPSSLLLPVVPE
jgi:predicted acyl esterase